jgi:acid stress-induced BolA-like protein IbaG/YrbA
MIIIIKIFVYFNLILLLEGEKHFSDNNVCPEVSNQSQIHLSLMKYTSFVGNIQSKKVHVVQDRTYLFFFDLVN